MPSRAAVTSRVAIGLAVSKPKKARRKANSEEGARSKSRRGEKQYSVNGFFKKGGIETGDYELMTEKERDDYRSGHTAGAWPSDWPAEHRCKPGKHLGSARLIVFKCCAL